jgi:hypothetical protein
MADIETGLLPAGHPYARIGTGSRHIEYPGASHLGPGKVFGVDACTFLGQTV